MDLTAALAAFERGDDAEAKRLCVAAMQDNPGDQQALLLGSNLALRSGDLDAAIDALHRLIAGHGSRTEWRRQLARLLNRRGAQYRQQADLPRANADFRRAVQSDSSNTDAWCNLALTLVDAGEEAAAAAAVTELLSRSPEDETGRYLAARLLIDRNPEAAIEQLGLLASEQSAAAVLQLADRLDQRGDKLSAVCYSQAARLAGRGTPSPLLRAQFGRRLALPAVVADIAELDRSRENFDNQLHQLDSQLDAAALDAIEPRLEQLAWCNFKLAYQGQHDRELQSRYGDLQQRILRRWFPQWSESPAAHGDKRRRIGLVSSSWRDCAVGRYFGGWIGWLKQAGYQVHLYQLGPTRDAHTTALAASAGTFHFHQADLGSLAERIRSDQLDLLIYPELGMDPRLFPLAGLRLARHQTMAWGHPVTSGVPSMDSYLSCAAMEPDDAAEHYRERLFPLPGLGIDYRPMDVPKQPTRAAGQRRNVLLPHSLFKLHPDNDAVIAELAALRPDADFILIREPFPAWNQTVQLRIQAAMRQHDVDASGRLHWLAPQPRDRFMEINANADLMLDALHWSGGNTTIDAISAGLPIMTAPGRFMRGRQSMAMLRLLDLPDLIQQPSRLAQAAATLLEQPDRLAEFRQQLITRRSALFDTADARPAFLDAIASMLTEA